MELTVKQQEARTSIQNLEDSLTGMWTEENDIFIGDSDFCPLKHHFTDGLYGREIFLKKDTIAIGKLHKKDSFVFIMSGEAKIVTENETKEVKGPCMFISEAGNKKAVHAVTDLVWIDVYHNETNTKDLHTIEDNVIAKNYIEYEEYKQLKN
tara:strand:+ start:81 stop:536 length:456 start_codon:yes stop_codon:yes gene_type:complete